jgi:putative glycosyl hydrolase-like family 6 (GHL6) protein
LTASLTRRSFLQATALTTSGFMLMKSSALDANSQSQFESPWYRMAYRRNVIDMHITDWNEKLLSEFNPENYVEMLRLSQVKSAVACAQSHVGLSNFPTKVGRIHNGMKSKDHLRRVIELCHKSGIGVQLYFSVIFDRWAYDNHPDWRIILVNGKESDEKSRQGLNCPNSPYREYVAARIEEICQQFDFEGIRFDMTFWPAVCYCSHCHKRFETEVGGELPKVIHWEDPRWVSFQRKREAWLVEFANSLTQKVKSLKPKASVEHQASTYTHSWRLGVTEILSRSNTFLQGDFYGDASQGSFVRKLFYNLSENLPYGFETSVMVSLQNHTAKKSKELLRTKAYACLADSGAFIFIDAIDPIGTLNRFTNKWDKSLRKPRPMKSTWAAGFVRTWASI